jgi:cytochrome c biogenesis protein CcdA
MKLHWARSLRGLRLGVRLEFARLHAAALFALIGTGVARGGLAGGLIQLVLYARGMGVVVSVLTMLFGLFGRGVLTRVRGASRLLQPLSAVLLLTTGAPMVYYWLSAGGR